VITSEERARLLEQFKDEPVYAFGLVLRCAAALLVIALTASIGVHMGIGRDVDELRAYTNRHVGSSIAHSRTLLEQRRLRFLQANPALLNAMPYVESPSSTAGSTTSCKRRTGRLANDREIEPC